MLPHNENRNEKEKEKEMEMEKKITTYAKIAIQLCKAEDSIREAKRELTRLGLPVDSKTWTTMTRSAEALRMIDPEDVALELADEVADKWAEVARLAKMGGM
jgi:hypothetical protein